MNFEEKPTIMGNNFESINKAKAPMGHIYNRPDPRAYYRELCKLDYAIPTAAKPIFDLLIRTLRRRRGETLHILDLGCSYGVNAALLKHDLSMRDLYEHWSDGSIANASPEEALRHERRLLEANATDGDIEIFGLDSAPNAVAFAERSGLIDEGFAINLEKEALDRAAAETFERVDLVISTGCVGYVTDTSFERLLPSITKGRRPWLANFVLRVFPFDGIAATLDRWGYVSEKLEGRTFVQRQFSSPEEESRVLDQLRAQGIDPRGIETEGNLHAEFFLSRPAEDARSMPIGRLIASA